MRLLAAAAGAMVLAGCQSTGESAGGSDAAYRLAKSTTDTIANCWFAAGEKAFAGYIYSPEPNNSPPRILIVPKAKPQDLPVLVVEAHGGNRLIAYGPFMDGASAARIRADLARWEKGGSACA